MSECTVKLFAPATFVALTIAALAFSEPIATASAQQPAPLRQADNVPIELAMALVASGGFGGEPQILVGAMPEWIAGRVYVPPTARVLGAAFLGTAVVAVVQLPVASDTVLAEFKRELLKRGWTVPPPAPVYAGAGFMPARPAPSIAPPTRLTLCGDQQLLTVSSARRGGVVTNVTLRVVGSTGPGPCHLPQMPVSMMRSPFPTLYAPEGALDARMSGDCSATMMGSMGTGTTLRTGMTADALLDHYGRQLADSGWTSHGDKGSVTGRLWTRPDSSGAPVEVVVSVTTSARDAGCRDLNLQVRTLKKP